jgi:hypothetical protein
MAGVNAIRSLARGCFLRDPFALSLRIVAIGLT